MFDWYGGLIAFLIGTVVGSFLNVVIFRIPEGMSIVWPRSHCMKCNTTLQPRDLIPLFSFLIQGRKCRYCGEPISWRYFTVELLTGLYFALLWITKGPNLLTVSDISDALIPALGFLRMAVFSAILIVILFIDLDHMIIPDELSLGAIAWGIIWDIIGIWVKFPGDLYPHLLRITIPFTQLHFPMLRSVAMMLVFGVGLLIIGELGTRIFKKEAMGGGDVKLVAAFGANMAWASALIGFFLAVLIGSVIGISLMVWKKKGRHEEVPFGPMLVMGALLAQIWGIELWKAYLRYAGLGG